MNRSSLEIGFLSVFLLISVITFSQKKVSKIFETSSKEINIYTAGLDNIILENSSSNFVEVLLDAESYDKQLINIEDSNNIVNIKFEFEGTETREVIFRKFITKRLQRANAIVKVPKGKVVYIFGENVDITAKDVENKVSIYIDNGIVKLNEIKSKTIVKLYSGNVYASIKNSNIEAITKTGIIQVDSINYTKKIQKYFNENSTELSIETIKANIFLTTQ
ncbi:hypothetical protein [Polaribacter septentrionalilitoris]|uniref:hypothetical protein n=1 Tax=Polaribacter septentrionalilitoris TaxID=2494657 RepID=UPI0013579B22|nr:hypothetical protein [Polaribacter septentrionalilitoris]